MATTVSGKDRTAHQAAEEFGDQSGKVFIVTGAYSGIGIETTKALLAQGGTVILAGRNETLQNEFVDSLKKDYDEKLIDSYVCNLGDLKTVKEFATFVQSKYDKIDALILNAGVGLCPQAITVDGFELGMGVNVIGHFLMAKLLLPQVIKAKGRQVWLSSEAHRGFGTNPRIDIDYYKNYTMDSEYNYRSAYQQSKLGDILLAKEFGKRDGIEAVSVHPGAIITNFGRNLTMFQKATLAFRLLWLRMSFKSLEQGAATTVTCALLPSDDERFVNGAYYADCEVGQETESAKNEQDARALYDYCDAVTKKFQ